MRRLSPVRLQSMKAESLERAYRVLSGDDSDERACEAIPESACTDVPRNYLLNLLNGACSKLGEQLAGPGLVLAWILGAIGAPAGLVGLLAPVRQAGALLPQLAVAGAIRAVALRKWYWVGAGLVQAVCLLSMAIAVIALPPLAAGVAIVVLLGVFSVASGVGSVAFQDVLGKTVPKGRRGSLLANRAAVGGALTLLAGAILYSLTDDSGDIAPVLWLLILAALLWVGAAAAFAAISERPGATEGGRNMLAEALTGVRLVREEPGFRRFLLARSALVTVEVAAPFYALHASELFGGAGQALGVFVVSVGFAGMLSSPVWGRFADRSSRMVMVAAALVAGAAAVVALAVGATAALHTPSAYAVVFILIGVAEAGVRLGRKTYLVDAAPAKERTLYVAFTNTVMGLFALVAGVIGVVAQAFGVEMAIATLGLSAVVAAVLGLATPESDRMAGGQTAGA